MYAVLGLTKEAKTEDISKAYKKLAMQWHPDRCKKPNAQERFQEISEAHETLSDPRRRRDYDFAQSNAGRPSMSGVPKVYRFTSTTTTGSDDIFQKLFPDVIGLGGMPRQTQPQRTTPLNVTLEDMYLGKAIILNNNNKLTTINLPPRCPNGKIITNGHCTKYKVAPKPHSTYTIQTGKAQSQNDLHITRDITLEELINGFSLIITTLDGKKKKISHKYSGKTVILDELFLTMPGMGLTKDSNMIIHLRLSLP